MKIKTRPSPSAAARIDWIKSILPSVGPIVSFSMMLMLTGSAPALSSLASVIGLLLAVKLPVICPLS